MNAKNAIFVFSLVFILLKLSCSMSKQTIPTPEPKVPETGYIPIQEVLV